MPPVAAVVLDGGIGADQQFANLLKRFTRSPALARQRFLRFGAVDPRSSLHASTPFARCECCAVLTGRIRLGRRSSPRLKGSPGIWGNHFTRDRL